MSHKEVPPLVLMTLPALKHGACVQLFEKATPVLSSASEFVGQLPPLLLPELLPLPEPLLPPLELPLLPPLPPPDEPDPPPLDPSELEASAPLSAVPGPAEPP
jgi:hypothetical protein